MEIKRIPEERDIHKGKEKRKKQKMKRERM